MKECSYCGELKPCRKETNYAWLSFRPEAIYYEWICYECDVGQKLLREHKRKENKRKESVKRKKWITLRDKLLKQNKQ